MPAFRNGPLQRALSSSAALCPRRARHALDAACHGGSRARLGRRAELEGGAHRLGLLGQGALQQAEAPRGRAHCHPAAPVQCRVRLHCHYSPATQRHAQHAAPNDDGLPLQPGASSTTGLTGVLLGSLRARLKPEPLKHMAAQGTPFKAAALLHRDRPLGCHCALRQTDCVPAPTAPASRLHWDVQLQPAGCPGCRTNVMHAARVS